MNVLSDLYSLASLGEAAPRGAGGAVAARVTGPCGAVATSDPRRSCRARHGHGRHGPPPSCIELVALLMVNIGDGGGGGGRGGGRPNLR